MGGGDRAPFDLRPQRHPHPSARKMLRIPECLLRNHRGDALMFRTKHFSSSPWLRHEVWGAPLSWKFGRTYECAGGNLGVGCWSLSSFDVVERGNVTSGASVLRNGVERRAANVTSNADPMYLDHTTPLSPCPLSFPWWFSNVLCRARIFFLYLPILGLYASFLLCRARCLRRSLRNQQ